MTVLAPEEKKRIRPPRPRDYVAWVAAVAIVAGLAYALVSNGNFHWDVVLRYFTAASILDGVGITLMLTAVSMVLGTVLGLVLAVMRMSSQRPISGLARLYITFFRGTPVLVQLVFWFNVAALYPNLSIGGHALDMNALITPLTAAIIGLTLNEAAYMAEIIRGGFAAVPRGQFEAAESLGMGEFTKLRRVIIPQTMPAIIPATGNQVIGMLKETSLVSVLGVADLLQSAQAIYARTYETIPLLIVASLWYLIMTLTLSVPQSMIERRFSRSSRPAIKVKESLL
ncbi:amino acid ABC transporter permease [Amycolatopsis balhimycina DSM 5908]|uniref:Amino acid ABC transporter permease n=1 Tax=Amycolatopsis balhimycina DSM 5908 TaxID=1081091 RepID=A0A428WW29_AMYBA|nr:amino acid ABC transporter permease [Amycolatopsis balhimycina]RSM47294.1 amino acid ABC transporter permease [Amycolatopsis balhimycina DSM 5908]